MKVHALFLTSALSFFLFTAAAQAYDSGDIVSGLIKSQAVTTEHFRVEFSNLILKQTDSNGNGLADVIDTVLESAEYSWDLIVEDLNYDEPIKNNARRVMVILDDSYEYLTPGALGVTSVLSSGDPYIALDPWMDEYYLGVTMGHEFFHAVQFGYDLDFAYTYQGIHWAEATATWVEDLLYDDNNDYSLYLQDYFDYPDYSLFSNILPSGTYFEYALNIWPRYLSENFNAQIIQDIWETYFNSSVSYDSDLKLYEAVKDVLDDWGSDLPTEYHEFALWNLDLDPYEEGELYPDVFGLLGTEGEYELVYDYAPALYGTNYLVFENDAASNFFFHIVKPKGASFAVSLVPVDGGDVKLDDAVTLYLDEDGEQTEALSLLGLKNVEEVVAVVSALELEFDDGYNWDVFDVIYAYSYLAEFGTTEENFSSKMDVEGQLEVVGNQDTVVKEGDEEGGADPRGKNTLILSIVNYDEDSVSFSWNRLNNSEIEGYELRYGTESEDYDEMETIDRDYTTFTTVYGLEEGESYYFQLVAVDAGDDEVGDPSPEVVVTLAEWLFTDVSYLNPYYDAISRLTEEGVFQGYADGSFKPDSEINRAELLKIFIEGRGIAVSASTYKNCFPDVKEEWFAKYVCYAKARGWVKGYPDGTYKPGNSVNKVEALKILFNVYEAGLSESATVAELNYPDLDTQAWYAIYVWKASNLGILEESFGGKFNPDHARSRAEMAEELYRYLVVTAQLKE